MTRDNNRREVASNKSMNSADKIRVICTPFIPRILPITADRTLEGSQ